MAAHAGLPSRIQGTRIQVAQVLDLVAAGKSFRDITTDYFAGLNEDDIRSCLEFARENGALRRPARRPRPRPESPGGCWP